MIGVDNPEEEPSFLSSWKLPKNRQVQAKGASAHWHSDFAEGMSYLRTNG